MKKIIFILCFSISQVFAQPTHKVKVMVLGVVHFGKNDDLIQANYGDLTSRKKQREVRSLVSELSKFNPTKIFVENTPSSQPFWDKVYIDLKNGFEPNDASIVNNEIYQIGLNLALKTNNAFGVICVNYDDREPNILNNRNVEVDSLRQIYSKSLSKNRIDYAEFYSQNPLATLVLKNVIGQNELWKKLDLIDHLKLLNAPKSINNLHYLNITAWLDQNPNGIGAELASKEYYRNARIMQNIFQRLNPFDKSILIIIGAAHVKSIKDMILVHPLLELEEF